MSIFSIFKRKNKKEVEKEQKKQAKNEIPETKLKTGIVFSGGGVRGFAYVGVIKAFKEVGIDFDFVAGTSIGSLIGAIYASGMSVEEMEKKALEVKQKDFTSSKLFFVPSKTERLEKLVEQSLPKLTFKGLKKPLCVVAVDLKTGKEVHITKGNLAKAIAGSCAVPGVFRPVEFGNYTLVDGGLVNNMPADALRDMGADIVVSLDINPTRGNGTESTKMLDVLKAALRILMVSNVVNGYVHSDYIIKIDLSDFSQLKMGDTKELIKRGYEATKKVIPEVEKILERNKIDASITKVSRKIKAIQKRQDKLDKLTEKLTEDEKKELEKIGKIKKQNAQGS